MSPLSVRVQVLYRLRWFNCAVIFLSPLAALYGIYFAPSLPHRSTILFSWAYYIFNMLGITAGYHRLWSHRSYSAHPIFQLFLAAGGSGAVQGSIRWWARTHRIHHRYTDTELDPYNAEWGLWWTHLGWMLVKSPSFEEKVARATRERERECERQLGRGPDRSGEKMPLVQSEEPKEQKAKVRVARVDVSDLDRNWIVRAQHEHYFLLAFVFGALVPVCIVGVVWGRWREAIVWPGLVRLIFVHHCTFAVNSLAHHLGHSPYPHPPPLPPPTTRSSHNHSVAEKQPTTTHDQTHPYASFPRPAPTARNHIITAILTLGEGYHAFHHAFPCDYRCAEDRWGFDPTKWIVAALAGDFSGLLKKGKQGTINDQVGKVVTNEKNHNSWALVRGRRVFEVKKWIGDGDRSTRLRETGLEEWTWEEYKEMSKIHPLVLIAGFIHDVRALLGPDPNGSSEDNEFSDSYLSTSTKRTLKSPLVLDSSPIKSYSVPALPSYPHPGGLPLLRHAIGTDASASFFGGVYEHGWGAHEMLAKMRVAILKNGVQQLSEEEINREQEHTETLELEKDR